MERNVLFLKAENNERSADQKKRSHLLWQKATHDDALIEAFDKRMCRNAFDPRAFSLIIT